ncbi:hypothetical protein [Candidatus Francisella endociliophora]|uniref:hypothetical protein n=1 Tax=Candidatus Francisella endociliophora TaxID=653937 RepID=UPI000A8D1945|nr:hypothetical protein [Francisella sp. FSC1006]
MSDNKNEYIEINLGKIFVTLLQNYRIFVLVVILALVSVGVFAIKYKPTYI